MNMLDDPKKQRRGTYWHLEFFLSHFWRRRIGSSYPPVSSDLADESIGYSALKMNQPALTCICLWNVHVFRQRSGYFFGNIAPLESQKSIQHLLASCNGVELAPQGGKKVWERLFAIAGGCATETGT